MKKLSVLIALALLATAVHAADKDKQAPGKGVFFVEPKNGATLGTEFKLVITITVK